MTTEEQARETCWMIEMIHNDAPIPRYWNGSKFKGGWVWDANEAIRFCREQDARDFLDGQRIAIGGRPVEHVFLTLPGKHLSEPTSPPETGEVR